MAHRVYVVTIETPEGDDEYDFRVTVTRHGKLVNETSAPMLPMLQAMGRIIGQDLEAEL